jgi:lipopolysaccharide transport system ATP-binding protein
LTGRENVFLNGAILGMTRRELADKFDEIVDFSVVEEFIDTPVKRYSSGMYVRLAFAVAAHLQPDILILDEVLAVGDATFQRKCLGKMNEAAKQGRTVLFVSHNMVAVQSLCTRGILLEGGRVSADGSASEVVQLYLSKGLSDGRSKLRWDNGAGPGNEVVRLVSFSVGPADANTDIVSMTEPIRVSLEYERTVPGKSFHLEIHVLTDQDITLLYSSPGLAPSEIGRYNSVCMIPGNLLNSGGYRIKVMIVEDESRASWLDDATLIFTVEDLKERRAGWMTRRPGLLYIPLEWRTAYESGDRPRRILVSNYESF